MDMSMSNPEPARTETGETEYTAPSAPPQRELRDVTIEKGANGGFIARASYKQRDDAKGRSLPYIEPDMYAFKKFSELAGYLADEFGASGGGNAVPDQGAPMGAPPPVPPPMTR